MSVNIRNFAPRLNDTDYPDFETPTPEQAIWRYFTLDKLKNLLEQQALWFARVDTFNEHFEGAIPLIEAQEFEEGRDQGKFDFLSFV